MRRCFLGIPRRWLLLLATVLGSGGGACAPDRAGGDADIGARVSDELAQEFREQLRVDVESVTCPAGGDVSAGFACQVTLAGGEPVTVDISAAPRPDRFIWAAEGLLMPAKIERGVREHLAARGRAAVVDCGSTLRKSTPGVAFPCDIRYADGATGTVEIRVTNIEGDVEIIYFENKRYP